ncbi:NarK family nitrate/nitrite MFS transporter [Synechococcus sp. NB0720_010]|jgi:NNP family nitrate/nitrite transporter-like MFS transporter|uniref:NarK family nitrate/nitrite MFS transporter n=1 Tax=Synechococcus sp. NB0720_010 TaxID=2907159 RepID=UPI001FFB7371|nr:NarK family nitrate/nitrite MFS transporter [Synechococcus sp. NB0720_010]UPH89383.1 NarK family nitrate/nitrite MFS transporter [Synechococcus sp. NB0720_010]
MLGDLWSLQGRYRTLHLTWFAFFLTFVVWFNLAPLATTVKADLGLDLGQIRTVAICNVALTIPARVLIGMLLDKFGPRKTYSAILVFSVIPCLLFASAQDFNQLVVARLLLSIVGAGFVIGIRMVAEWFPPKEIGLAEGIYGGWGNFGSAFSALTLVALAGFLSFSGGFELPTGAILNWRGAIALTGIISAVYGVIYFFSVTDTPPGKAYQKPAKSAGLEVTSMRDFWGLLGMNVPFAAILCVLCWRLQKVGFLNAGTYPLALLAVLVWFGFQTWGIIRTNRDLINGVRQYPKEDRYEFKQVAILELTYIVNFGSELAVVSMLPTFFETTFDLPKATAGILASCFAFVNLVARPGGGLISDKLGSRKNTMAFLTGGLGIGYLIMSMIKPGAFSGSLGITVAVLITMLASFFVQAGEGATFAMVPLVKKRVTGQIAGLVGAYGNVGAVAYLTIFSLLPMWMGGGKDPSAEIIASSNSAFFQILGTAGLIVAFLCFFFLKEPKGSFAEEHADEKALVNA